MPPRVQLDILGVHVDLVQIPQVVERMEAWIEARERRYVCVANVQSVMVAQEDPAFRRVLNDADLCVPDGMPLVWTARLYGHRLRRRVYGPELMLEFCRASARRGRRHFLYGGAPGVAEKLAERLGARCPGLQVAGWHSPPFRPLTPREEEETLGLIRAAAPDVVWVGLGCPKQERWMASCRGRLEAPVLVGVGAAFDFFSGRVRQARPWVREHGLEWLFRLTQDPGRLAGRYLVQCPPFIPRVLRQWWHDEPWRPTRRV
ncbi:MAG: WecB/TagA/CpsF family glycosyltransferase [Candidatus Latescibacterota bacterium]